MAEVSAIFEYQCAFIENRFGEAAEWIFFHGCIYWDDKMTCVDIITADLSKQVCLRLHDILNKI